MKRRPDHPRPDASAGDLSAGERVAIVGLGLMGGSFAAALRAKRPELTLVGVDRDEAVVRKGLARGLVTIASTQPEAVAGSRAVMLAVPLSGMAAVLAAIAPFASGAAVTDMAGVKVPVLELARAVGVDLVGGHPMCGRELSGIDAAEAALFEGAPWILTRRHAVIEELVTAVGARPVVVDAERHDRFVAGVSHTAHLLSVAYVLALSASADWAQMSRLAGPGFRDMSRLAAGDAQLYAEIASANRPNIVSALDDVSASISRVRRHLEASDGRLVELLEEAQAARQRWAEGRHEGNG